MSTQKVSNAMIADMDAGKLTGALPALDGSALTGLPDSVTKNANDPAIDTNPSGGLGTLWLNTTSGELFACSDATAGANVWTNVGAGTGDVQPWLFGGTSYGYDNGGYTSTTSGFTEFNSQNRFSFTSDGNAADHGDLTVAGEVTGSSGETHGYHSGHSNSTTIDKFAYATNSNSTDVGDLTVSRGSSACSTSETHGYTAGGEISWPSFSNVVDRYAFSSDGNASDVGDLTGSRYNPSGQSSSTNGYACGGYVSAPVNVMDKYTTTSSTGNATDIGDLSASKYDAAGTSSATHGYVSGGYTSTYVNVIEKFSFSSDGNASDIADLTFAVYRTSAGTSSTTYGYVCGGRTTTNAYYNVIQKHIFSSDSNATDVGDLQYSRSGGGGVQT